MKMRCPQCDFNGEFKNAQVPFLIFSLLESLLQNKLHSPVNNFTFNHETNFHDPITIFLEKTAKTGAFLA